MQQQAGNLFACVEDAFSHEWVEFHKADFDAFKRNRQAGYSNITNDAVRNVYENTREAAMNDENVLSSSPNPMRLTGVHHARLCNRGCPSLSENREGRQN